MVYDLQNGYFVMIKLEHLKKNEANLVNSSPLWTINWKKEIHRIED